MVEHGDVAVRLVANEALKWAAKVRTVGDRAWCRMIDWLEWNSHTPISTDPHLFDGERP